MDAGNEGTFHFSLHRDGLDCLDCEDIDLGVTVGPKEYFDSLPQIRRDRLVDLKRRFQQAVPDAQLTMRYRMPTFERADHWTCLGNQKNHISVYFCSEEIIAPVVADNPKLNCGKGCVRIRDTQEVPIEDLVDAFRRAMGIS